MTRAIRNNRVSVGSTYAAIPTPAARAPAKSNAAWKKLATPYKAYLQAIYPAPADVSQSSKSRWWFLKMTKNDFDWIDGKPVPKMRADLPTNIKRAITERPISTALALRSGKEYVRAKIAFDDYTSSTKPGSRFFDGEHEKRHFSINIGSDHDAKMLNLLLSFDKKWHEKYLRAKDDFDRLSAADKEKRAGQMRYRASDSVLNSIARKDLSYTKFIQMDNLLRKVHGWLEDKGLFITNDDYHDLYDADIFAMYVFDKAHSTGYVRPPNFIGAGAAYSNPIRNCALVAIEEAMQPITEQQKQTFEKLQTRFAAGVYTTDYEEIANALNLSLYVSFAPNDKVGEQWRDDSVSHFGKSNRQTVHLHHWSNHATAKLDTKLHEYKYATPQEMYDAFDERYDQIYATGPCSITFRSKSNGGLETLQLEESSGIKLALGKPSPQATLMEDFRKQITPYPYNDPNRESYDMFAHHGVHYSTGLESFDDIDLDLKQAYTNYYKLPNYSGLPRDITYWFNNPSIDEVRANKGRVYAKFTEPLSEEELTMWISTEETTFLHDNGFLHEMHHAAFAHSVFDLDLSKFVDMDPEVDENGCAHPTIHKRVFHMLLGLSTMRTHKKTFYTMDDLEISDRAASSPILPACLDRYIGQHDALWALKTVRAEYPVVGDRYLHVAGAIQSLITCELWRKWLEIKSANPNARLVSALVDGIRIAKDGFDINTLKEDPNWVQKPIRYICTPKQFDWKTKQELHKRPVISADKLTRMDWPIEIAPEFANMLSVKQDGELSFMDLANEGYISSLQGYAGTGKSYTVRKLLEQFNAIILTPTHATREDMSTHSIRNYIDNKQLTTIPVKTYQSVIQRKHALRDYSVVIVDEAGMLLTEHLNRLVEIAQRKLILFVGDPAQHKPIHNSPMYLHAKYLVFKNYIMSDDKLKDIYENGSDWERNNMLQHIHLDCEFEMPEYANEEEFDAAEAKRQKHINRKRLQIKAFEESLTTCFGTFTASQDAFDSYVGGKMLSEIKRADDTEDGQALIRLSSIARESAANAIKYVSTNYPELCIKSDDVGSIYSNPNCCVVATCTSTLDEHNSEFLKSIQVDAAIQASTKAELDAILESELSSEADLKAANIKLEFNYPGVEIAIVARETFSYAGHKVFNGTQGTCTDFVMKFDGHTVEIPVCEVRKPTTPSKLNPYLKPTLFAPKVQCMYAITSYRVQGKTISDKLVYVDCSYYSNEMMYVAITRATKLSQLRFINVDACMATKAQQAATVEAELKAEGKVRAPFYIETDSLKLGFTVSKVSNVKYNHGDPDTLVGRAAWLSNPDNGVNDLVRRNICSDFSSFDYTSVLESINAAYTKKAKLFHAQKKVWKQADVQAAVRKYTKQNAKYSLESAKSKLEKEGIQDWMKHAYHADSKEAILACINCKLAELEESTWTPTDAQIESGKDTFRRFDTKYNLIAKPIYSTMVRDGLTKAIEEYAPHHVIIQEWLPETPVEAPKPKHLSTKEHAALFRPVYDFLHAQGISFKSNRVLVDKDTKEYKHPVEGKFVIRVEKNKERKFYWIQGEYNVQKLAQFVGLVFKGEAHEVITGYGSRMFFDIDLKLTEDELTDLSMHFDANTTDELAASVANIYNESILLSLENHGLDREELGELISNNYVSYDYAYTTRNRPVDGGYKISIHLMTNLMMHTERCAAIATDCKELLTEAYELDLPEDIGALLAGAIDVQPYHKNGSLSMEHGCKSVDGETYHNVLAKPFYLSNTPYLLTDRTLCLCNADLSAYPLRERIQQSLADFEGDFMQHALEAARHIDGIEAFDMDLARQYGNNLIPRRMEPSHCHACNRVHDSDNTLMLSFNEKVGCCWWKCTHDQTKHWYPFYHE
jgi:hypothetical protein